MRKILLSLIVLCGFSQVGFGSDCDNRERYNEQQLHTEIVAGPAHALQIPNLQRNTTATEAVDFVTKGNVRKRVKRYKLKHRLLLDKIKKAIVESGNDASDNNDVEMEFDEMDNLIGEVWINSLYGRELHTRVLSEICTRKDGDQKGKRSLSASGKRW